MACVNQSLESAYRCNGSSSMPYQKYKPWADYTTGLLPDDLWPKRQWPDRKMLRAPRWCSVDLRDGNQALVNPMDLTKKLEYFRCLVKLGFKEIEIGFPSASKLDADFAQLLIQQSDLVPDDVWLMVLVQGREHLIKKTIEIMKGTKKLIVHLYNSTSELQRRVVFKASKNEVKQIAVAGTRLIRHLTNTVLIPSGCSVRFEYSPESFTGTELPFALEVCHAVMDEWHPTPEDPIILNLPETVQNAGPHFYADQIEWMSVHLSRRSSVVLSIHPHNDRGTGVASAELAMLAGADRVEGCLFGNGERTGNVCLVTLAINLLHHGIDPELDFSDISSVICMYEGCTDMAVPPRHPWAGSLVYTAFSGSHQDAIKKGFEAMKEKQHPSETDQETDQETDHEITINGTASGTSYGTASIFWEVPYLPIDPKDLGRSYETVVRVNSQSGKGGVAYVMQERFGIELPKAFQMEFSAVVQKWCDAMASEAAAETVYALFEREFVKATVPILLIAYRIGGREVMRVNNGKEIGNGGSPKSNGSLKEKMVLGDQEMLRLERNRTEGLIELNGKGEGAGGPAEFVNQSAWLTNNENQSGLVTMEAQISLNDQTIPTCFVGMGNGPVDAFTKGLLRWIQTGGTGLLASFSAGPDCQRVSGGREFKKIEEMEIEEFYEMSLGKKSDSEAICFIQIRICDESENACHRWGVGRHSSTTTASLLAVCSAVNRIFTHL